MQRIAIVLLVIAVLAVTFMLAGCTVTAGSGTTGTAPPTVSTPAERPGPPPWAPAHGYRAKYHYRYFPDPRVYYDIERSLYFYYGNGAWQVSATLPSSVRIEAGEFVLIGMDEARPYQYQAAIEQRYPPGQGHGRGYGQGRGQGHGRN